MKGHKEFHQARWNEPLLFEKSFAGRRCVIPPRAEKAVERVAGDGLSTLPEGMLRETPPVLPEIAQPQLIRHYNHLSQENLGADSNIDIGQGTCTMKYSPKINDMLAGSPKLKDMHPLQNESTAQGILEIFYRTGELFREISGLACCSLQPGGGSHGVLAMATMVRAWHKSRGEGDTRDEIITTFFSHPADAAVPRAKGYKVIVLPPDEEGLPDIEAYRAAVSERTAAIFFTNPEDTGIFNSSIRDFTRLAREKGALCCYDQANANGLLGVTRAREAGFDMSFFNLHKTFSSPHGCGGPATGLLMTTAELRDYLPAPIVEYDVSRKRYFLDYELPQSCGKIKDFYGVAPVVVRAYAWIMSLGTEGLMEVSRAAVLNNNYFMKKMLAVKGCSISFPKHPARVEQVRYSWEQLHADTGFGTSDIQQRAADFGTHYWMSHEPWVVPEPVTIEPTESYSKEDLDEYLRIMEEISRECYEEPEIIRHAPHNSTIHHIDHDYLDDPGKWAITWRCYRKRYHGYFEPIATE